MTATLDIRSLADCDDAGIRDWQRALHTGFHIAPSPTDEEMRVRRAAIDPARTQGAFDGDRCVATFRSMPRELTVPGGAFLPASAITNVSVTATHRRRGLASRMMATELAASRERGESVAILVAAEYPIYGRYGFGPATWVANWEVEVPRAVTDRRYAGPDDGGRVDLVPLEDVRTIGPELHERVRASTPGAINRLPLWWQSATGQRVVPSAPWKEPFFVAYRDPAGQVQGLAAYTTTEHHWPGKLPRVDATVQELITTTSAAERALWRFLLSLDWVTLLKTGYRAPDDVLPLLLDDPRAAVTETLADFMWLRLLDVPAALSARGYAGGAAALVLGVEDEAGFAAGRFLLETDASGAASCTPTAAAADLTLSAADLACLYLGDESAVRLAALDRLTEHRPGAATLATTLFRTARRPWCPELF
ncbi:GNAT family N-acetyltransferase [Streptomyces sp. V4-01]|uniref:GNAT family N-acetyltransferase n=1 Tax=Actinacidiphila polyblastidii TaxID=3110430 RepID=A0ABU7PIU1_9ACTN|nr:GNAT family N-acetyltransferase [Streptomyces sp. V4-01]